MYLSKEQAVTLLDIIISGHSGSTMRSGVPMHEHGLLSDDTLVKAKKLKKEIQEELGIPTKASISKCNLKDQSFKDLWSSRKKKNMFDNLDASKVCDYMCLYESRNKFINELLNKNPFHVNFI